MEMKVTMEMDLRYAGVDSVSKASKIKINLENKIRKAFPNLRVNTLFKFSANEILVYNLWVQGNFDPNDIREYLVSQDFYELNENK